MLKLQQQQPAPPPESCLVLQRHRARAALLQHAGAHSLSPAPPIAHVPARCSISHLVLQRHRAQVALLQHAGADVLKEGWLGLALGRLRRRQDGQASHLVLWAAEAGAGGRQHEGVKADEAGPRAPPPRRRQDCQAPHSAPQSGVRAQREAGEGWHRQSGGRLRGRHAFCHA